MKEFTHTVSLEDDKLNIDQVGGKGYNLSILHNAVAKKSSAATNNVLNVPIGFVVTVQTYQDFLYSNPTLKNEIETSLNRLKNDDGSTVVDHELLEQVSKEIRESFRQRSLSSALQNEISQRLQDLISKSKDATTKVTVAIRSSATCEDLDDASFAGQHDTYLNILATSEESVYKHVIECFSSLFSARAISYRQLHNIDHMSAGMAVVIQQMIKSESSGVLFTANPVSGYRTQSVIEIIPGLGEALVSGLTEPDRYIVSNNNESDDADNRSRILDKKIGSKLKTIRPNIEGGGVKEEEEGNDGDNKTASAAVLTDDIVSDIVDIGQLIQHTIYQGQPQDVEFAIFENKIYIVQTRAITTLFPLPQTQTVNGEDEQDDVSVYFSFGAIQGVTKPMYPSGQDTMKHVIGAFLKFLTWNKYGNKNQFFAIAAERLYANFTNVIRNSIGRKIILNFLQAVEPSIKAGSEQTIEDHSGGGELSINSGMTPFVLCRILALASCAFIPRYIETMLFPDRSRNKAIKLIANFVEEVEMESSKAHTLKDVITFKNGVFSRFFPTVVPNIVPRIGAGISPLYMLKKLSSSIDNGADLVLTITRGLPHNVTTEMDLKLWEVAQMIRCDVRSMDMFQSTDVDTLASDYLEGTLPDVAQKSIDEFMKQYGMRGLCEIDLGRPRWREEPAPLMQTLKSYVGIDDENAAPDKVFAAGEVAAENAISELGKQLGRPRLVSFLASRTRAIAGLRELPKFAMIQSMGIIRQKLLEEGKKLVQGGILDEARDIFLLHDDELLDLADDDKENRSDYWKSLVAERKVTMERENDRISVPRVITSDGFAFYGGATSSSRTAEGDDVLLGEPVSPGTVEGRVRIILDPSKTKLEPGEVLVCPGTDPSWTPLFLAASALITEVGGIMTHGSVVAREYGIPAVVGIEKATERLQSGQLIRVDGSSGVIEILKE